MSFMKTILGATAALALTAGASLADPAIIFDLGGKFDKSFNEAAYNGAERWKTETGGSYRELEMQSEAQREQALRGDCPDLYITSAKTGTNVAAAIEKLAQMVAAREFSDAQ